MKRLVVIVALVSMLTPVASAQRPGSPIWDILDSLSESDDGPPTLQEIFSDIGVLLKNADKSKVKVLEARLAETEEEIHHLENLKSTLDRGILIDMPDVLKERLDVPASKLAIEREKEQIDELKAQMRFLSERRRRKEQERKVGEAVKAPEATRRGAAALDVVLKVPEPPATPTATEKQIRDAVDKVAYGKALYLARDYKGALKSYEQLPEEERSLETRYHMARCSELLDRWNDAKQISEAVSTADPTGHWGGLARWMLDLGTRKQGIRGMINASKGEGNGMNGVAPESLIGAAAQLAPGLSPEDVSRLQENFKVFNQVTRSLERAYSRLENRAAGVESRLQDANGRLRAKVTQLKTVTAELNGILDAIPCGVVACDKDGTITTMNPAAERILGRSRDEIRGRDARALLDHRGRPILLSAKDDINCGTIVERLVCCLDGSERYLSGSLAELPDGGRLEILSDQTEVAHLRSQVTRLDTLAELGEMAAGVAHEIRNPMSAVEGFAGLMEKALRDQSQPADAVQLRRYADRVRKGVAEVNGIITNLLLWARPEPARMETVDVNLLLDEVSSDVSASPAHSETTVELDVPDAAALAGDRLKLKLAVGNLVRNAVESAGTGGRVRVSTRREAQWLQILVDDDGPGIAASVRARLFRPFTTTKPTGTGLGLALVRKFAELHGGSVATAPCPLGGARFVLSLPIRDGGKA